MMEHAHEVTFDKQETVASPLPFKTWHLPLFQPSTFVERASLPNQLAESLWPSWAKDHQAVGVVACCGLGGVGKTSLARQYIHQPLGNPTYTLRAWFNAEWLDMEYRDFAQDVGLVGPDEKITPEAVRTEVKIWLEAHPGWLLVFDNIATYNALEAYLPQKGGNVLATSRNPNGWLKVIPVEGLREAEAVDLLQRLTGYRDGSMPALAKELGYLPLALAQAGAYIKQKGKTPAQYLSLYHSQPAALLADNTLPPGAQHQHIAVAKTWMLNVKSIEAQCPEAKTALDALAYVQAEQIPMRFLQQLLYGKIDSASEVQTDTVLQRLSAYSLIQIQPNTQTLSLHRLVQTVMRSQHEATVQKAALENSLKALNALYVFNPVRAEDQQRNRQLIAHWEAVLGHHAHATMAKAIFLEPEVLATSLDCLAQVHLNLGHAHEAKALLERALTLKETHYGKDHWQLATTLGNLSNAYGDLGDAKTQKTLLEQVLTLQETHYGKDHWQLACTLENLGNAYGDLGDAKTKKALLERALTLKETHYGKDHWQLASTLDGLGFAYGDLGDAKTQKNLLERALTLKETHYGKDHWQLATTLGNLSNAYGDLGDAKTKKTLVERVLTLQEAHYGKDHWQLATTLVNLGNAYGDLGDAKTQKTLLERALTLKETHYGKDHWQLASTLEGLGTAYGALGDAKTQKTLLERSLTLKETHYGKDHWQLASALVNLSNAYGALGDAKTQKTLLERSLTLKETHYGKDHWQAAITLGNLGKAYEALQAIEPARQAFSKAYTIASNHYGEPHAITQKLKGWLNQLPTIKTPTQALVTSTKVYSTQQNPHTIFSNTPHTNSNTSKRPNQEVIEPQNEKKRRLI